MNNRINILNWDSDFFNMKICQVNDNISDKNEFGCVLKELNKLDINLGYYSSQLPLNELQSYNKLYNIILVDKKTTYLKKIKKTVFNDNAITEYKGNYPTDNLINLAIQSGIHSRFNVDKKIGAINYQKLYKEWIINSVNKTLAKEVLVYLKNKIIIGLITLGEKKSIADIGIIAVAAGYRNNGIGKSLMLSAENWFAHKDYNDVQVVTQADNISACRLYESCGYKIDKVEYFYHLWRKGKTYESD